MVRSLKASPLLAFIFSSTLLEKQSGIMSFCLSVSAPVHLQIILSDYYLYEFELVCRAYLAYSAKYYQSTDSTGGLIVSECSLRERDLRLFYSTLNFL